MNNYTRKNEWMKNTEGGFTLIELVFVFVIFAIMSSIVLFNFRGFNARVQFDNLAQDIALQIVQAQKAAINGATNVNFTGPRVRTSYGVFFVAGPGTGTSEKQFVYFNDIATSTSVTEGDKKYAEDGCIHTPPFLDQECLSVTSITTGEYISAIRYKPLAGGGGVTLTNGRAHIVFTRPFPDAILNTQIGTGSTLAPAQAVCVELSSKDGTLKKTISVSNLGAIRTVVGSISASTSPCY